MTSRIMIKLIGGKSEGFEKNLNDYSEDVYQI